jgi:crotonobetainyl-CoA:carnitine CoA-transferase CaiB-like acyl-CoA transferase
MKRSPAVLPIIALLGLTACGGGGQSQAENNAEVLEEAAEQSDPAAAQVLENAADAARDENINAQQALQNAGNAQATTLPQPQQTPPSVQAQPNQGGQQTPPPKQPTGAGAAEHRGNAH